MKKILSVVLLISMLLGMWIMPAGAAEGDSASGTEAAGLTPTYYVDANSDKEVIDKFIAGGEANYEIEDDGYLYIKSAAVTSAPGAQATTFTAPLIMTAEINSMPVTKEGANVQLWLNLKDGLTHNFRYYPLEQKFTLVGPSGEIQSVETDWATGENAEWHRLTMSVEADGTITCYADDVAVITYQIPNFDASLQTGLVPILWKDGGFELFMKSFAVYELDQALGSHPEVYFNLNTESEVTEGFLTNFFGGAADVYELQDDGTIYMKSGAVAPGPTTGAAAQDFFVKGDFVTELSLKMVGTSYKEDAYRSIWIPTSMGNKTLQVNPGKGTVTYGTWNGEAEFTKEVDWATGENAEWHTLAIEVLPSAGKINSYIDGELVYTATYEAFTAAKAEGFQPLLFGNCETLMQSCVVANSAYLNQAKYLFNLNAESEVTEGFLTNFFGGAADVYELQDDGTIYMKSGAVAPGPTTGAAAQDFFVKGDFVTELSLKMVGTSYKEDAYRSIWIPTSMGNKTLQVNPGKGTVTYGTWNGEAEFTKEVDWATGENAEWHTLAIEVLPSAGKINSYIDGELVYTATYEAFTAAKAEEGFQPLLFGNCETLMQYCAVITGAYMPGYAVGHDETQSILTLKAATCTETGTELVRCTGCGTLAAAEVAAAGHTSSDWIVDKAATCTEKGSQHKECTVCGETLETGEIDMIAHTPSDWIVDKAATEEEDGSQHKECTVCKTVLETEAIPKLQPSTPPFTDVAEDAWYYDYVAYVYRNNLFLGTSDTTFEPDTVMTRAMFVRLLANYEGVDFTQYEDAELPFTDVDMDEWYGTAVAWAYENEVVLGTSDTTFNPGDEITREQMCLMLVNYMNYKEITLEGSDKEVSFTDADKIADWAKDAVELCAAAGIVQGPGDGSFNPQGTASRAEVATLITNFCNALADQPEE